MKLPRTTPLALHFGEAETRLLQLHGRPGGWKVRYHACLEAGPDELLEEGAAALPGRFAGRDAVVGLGAGQVETTILPADAEDEHRRDQLLRQAALASVEDEEGVSYRWLPLGLAPGTRREEVLLLAAGAAALRHAETAVDGLGLRPVSLEPATFGLARAVLAMRDRDSRPWGFLHAGFGQAVFGILHEGEIRFLKPLQQDGRSFLAAMTRTAEEIDRATTPTATALDLVAPTEEAALTTATAWSPARLRRLSIDHAVELLGSVERLAALLADEVQACLRHFHSRHKGAEVTGVCLSGFGATLPGVEEAIQRALRLPVAEARPFSELGILAPAEILEEEPLWAPALGLTMRGYE